MFNCKESGSRVQLCRKNAGLSMSDLAGRSGITYQYVSRIEKGNSDGVSVKTMERIADSLRVDLAYLLYIQDVPVKQPVEGYIELYELLPDNRKEDIYNTILMYLSMDKEEVIDELLQSEGRIDALFNDGTCADELRRLFLRDLLTV